MDTRTRNPEDAGLPADLPRTLVVCDETATFRSTRLRRPETNRAVLGPTARVWLVIVAVLVVAILALGVAANSAMNLLRPQPPAEDVPAWVNAMNGAFGMFFDKAAAAIAGIVGIGFAVIGIGWLTGRIGPQPTVFDLRRELITNRGRKADPLLKAGLPVSQVAAVQVCVGTVTVQDSEGNNVPVRTFEMNLVLRSPPGYRIHLVGHADEKALHEDARQLADLLGVPLVDSTTGEESGANARGPI